MSSILSTISGQFSKVLLLGSLPPAFLFVVFFLLFIAPLVPVDMPLLAALARLDTQGQLFAVSLVTFVLALLLYHLSIPILQMYEGYPWKDFFFGRWCVAHYRARYYAAEAEVAQWRQLSQALSEIQAHAEASKDKTLMRSALDAWLKAPATAKLLRGLPADDDQRWAAISAAVVKPYQDAALVLNGELPPASLLLPTRLGNVIRSFENYPAQTYNIDTISLWPHLLSVVDSAYAASIDDAKTAFDFMLNCSLLSTTLLVFNLGLGLLFPPWTRVPQWLLAGALFLALAWIFYNLSIGRADAWGRVVRGAFDLYKGDLLKKLGYTQKPTTRQSERELWLQISRAIIYAALPFVVPPDYAAAPARGFPRASQQPADIELEITRGARLAWPALRRKVVLVIHNPDKLRDAGQVVVSDMVAAGLEYDWESARCEGRSVPVTGLNPYEFQIGTIEKEKTVMLSYDVFAAIAPKTGGDA